MTEERRTHLGLHCLETRARRVREPRLLMSLGARVSDGGCKL